MFFAFASAFIALSVSLRPFASRYASTAGTRSAAFAAIVEEGADSRDGAPQRSVQQAPQQAPRVSAPKSGAGVEGKKKPITKRTISHRNNLSPDCLPIRSTRVTSPAADALAREKATVHIARGRGKKGLRAALCGDAFSPPRVVAALPAPHSARRTFGARTPLADPPPPRAVAMSAAGYDNLQLRGEYGTEPYWPEKKLKICVTGAGGFIASHLAKRLKEEGHHVVGCDWKRNEHMPVRHRARANARRERDAKTRSPRRDPPARRARAPRARVSDKARLFAG